MDDTRQQTVRNYEYILDEQSTSHAGEVGEGVSKIEYDQEEQANLVGPDGGEVDDDGNLVEIEEETIGEVVQGENGQYYMLIEEPMNDGDGENQDYIAQPVDVGDFENISLMVNSDGSQTIVLENGISDNARFVTIDQDNEEVIIQQQHENETEQFTTDTVHVQYNGKLRPAKTIVRDTTDGPVKMYEFVDEEGTNFEVVGEENEDVDDLDDEELNIDNIDLIPQGLKTISKRNRQYGNAKCNECGASFISTARLERHLAVHQIFGSYLCPLCGKTYKYEYNLFYHWRKTCRDLNELIPTDERITMTVESLRTLVDEVAQKKMEIGPIDIGISRGLLFQSGPLARLEVPQNHTSRRGASCRECGVSLSSAHMARHLAVHRGEAAVDQRSVAGGFICDLCGLMFRQHFNLIKHWRSSCPEIQANLPEDVELTLDDTQLKSMVADLLKRNVTAASKGTDPRMLIQADRINPPIPLNTAVTIDRKRRIDMNDMEEDEEESNRQLIGEEEEANVPGSNNREEKVDTKSFDHQVYADDYLDDEVMAADGISNMGTTGTNRSKWQLQGGSCIQCPECFRQFANTGRLERHIAGFHASYGTYHCILCGNRFKYDYNLLYHYRRSCPYTKVYIDRDVREQMDAGSLRKLVRQLAQKEIKAAPLIREESTRLLTANVKQTQVLEESKKTKARNNVNPPAHLLTARIGLADALPCPICAIVFYGQSSVERHTRAAHSIEYQVAVRIRQDNEAEKGEDYIVRDDMDEYEVEEEEVEDIPPPPLLEPQGPSEPVPEMAEEEVAETDVDELAVTSRSGVRFVDEDGVEVSMEEMRRLIDSGQIQMHNGDQIILMEDGMEYQIEEHEYQMEPSTSMTDVGRQEAVMTEDNKEAIQFNESSSMRTEYVVSEPMQAYDDYGEGMASTSQQHGEMYVTQEEEDEYATYAEYHENSEGAEHGESNSASSTMQVSSRRDNGNETV